MSIRLRAVAFAVLSTIVGCSSQGSVSGKVTFNGNPLTSGIVTFHALGQGPTGIGSIGPDGRYEISVGTVRGLPAGEYGITVEAYEPLEEPKRDAKGFLMAPKAPKRITPQQYADKDKPQFKRTVTTGSNTVDLDL